MTMRVYGRQLTALARALVRQARELRDMGLKDDARELARRALAYDRLGWSYCAAPSRIVRRG